MSQPRLHIRKGDTVLVIAGKDKGERGSVIEARPRQRRVIGGGVNIAKKHKKPRGRQPGGIMEVPMPVDVSNVMLVCPSCSRPTRVQRRRVDSGAGGKATRLIRVCKRCSAEIDEV